MTLNLIYGRYNALKESVDMAPGQEGKKEAEFNEDYLYACGISSNSNINNTLYRFAGMLFVIIIVGSASMIYNAFSISVSERTRQFGLISSVAALAAVRLCPDAKGYMLASHISNEPAGRLVLEALGLKPAICAEMCLGEGTGAVAMMPLLDMALAMYGEMCSFDDYEIDAYEHLT